MRKLPPEFYRRSDPTRIARDLLGKHVFSLLDGQLTGGRIIETEAYSHHGDNSLTMHLKRLSSASQALREPGGQAYLYKVYQRHTLFNICTNEADKTDTVLIRAIEPLVGLDVMQERRGNSIKPNRLTAGPGMLTQALGLTPEFTGTDLQSDLLWIADQGETIPEARIIAGPRIGLDYAGPAAAGLPWNFQLHHL
ncbi:DNA-3-methyladenine glycosylase [Hymenobacter psychrophilus]|uniref:Putative 3-methyladenine DNA glycosylase n=1 Tax=Hymenobacter psychrophilus TaxID=651662 RepID=A0A1H3EMN3_9BACT|nr:DNA-3-methyladenine glycosylase [Hymenobacter psychrophilus]SDX79214.1 DNA-3-methyladenine glycosylase [Hymenobacter psychrophilus]